MALLLPTRNPLAYPAGVAPGFDPTHVAGKSVEFSAISVGGNFINLFSGIPGTITGSPTPKIDGKIGVSTTLAGEGSTNQIGFINPDLAAYSGVTYAAILILSSIGTSAQGVVANGNGTSSSIRFASTTGIFTFVLGGVAATASILAANANVPYFVAASWDGSIIKYLLADLSKGLVLTDTKVFSHAGVGPAGGFIVGNSSAQTQGLGGSIATAMYGPGVLSMSQLLQWAADPWSFWYPDRGIDDFMVGGAGANAYTLAVNPGLYGFTGEQVVPASARKLYPVQGVFAWAGKSVGVASQRKIAASQGVFSLTGEPIVPAAQRKIAAAQGVFSLTGESIAPAAQRKASASPGIFSWTGEPIIPAAQRKSTLSPGVYSLTGEAVTFKAARAIAAATGIYALTSPDITITKSGVGSFTLVVGTGFFSLAGKSISAIAARKLTLVDGVFAWTGEAIGVAAGRKMAAAQGIYSMTGEAVGTQRGYGFVAQPGIFSLSGKAISFRWIHVMAAATGKFSFNGQPVGLTKGSGVHIIAQPALSGIDGSVLLKGYNGTVTLKGWVN